MSTRARCSSREGAEEAAEVTEVLIPDKHAEVDKARKKLMIACALCAVFMVAEVVGGIMAGSLAILTDAAHLLSDMAGFFISLFALFLVKKPATKENSFGYHRAEVLGAMLSVMLIWALTGILVFEAVERIQRPRPVNGKLMFIIAACGVVFNLAMGYVLHQPGQFGDLVKHGHSHGGGGSDDDEHEHEHGEDHHGHSHGDSHGHSHGASESHGHSHGGGERHGHAHGGDSHGHGHGGSGEHAHGSGEKHGHAHGAKASTPAVAPTYGSINAGDLEAPPPPPPPAVHRPRKKSGSSHGHSHGNLNVRAAFIHVVGDLVQSVGVMIAAAVIWARPHLTIVDPICTFLFSILVLLTTAQMTQDSVRILMEGTPDGVDVEEVEADLLALPDVIGVHDLHIWSLTMGKVALSVHIATDIHHYDHVLVSAQKMLLERWGIDHTTIQVEKAELSSLYTCTDDPCGREGE